MQEMRRNRQALSPEDCAAVFRRGTSGVLALEGLDGYPYAVPLSYCYQEGALIFHCARSGHKLEAIRRCPKASFCVIDQDQVVPEEYTTYFRSAIAFGTVRVLEDPAELRSAVEALADRYAPELSADYRNGYIDRELDALCMLKLEIAHMTGKEAKELLQQREQPAGQQNCKEGV